MLFLNMFYIGNAKLFMDQRIIHDNAVMYSILPNNIRVKKGLPHGFIKTREIG